MTETDTSSHRQVPAVSRSIAILRLLGRSEKPIGVNQIARELGLIPSTCLHILRVLTQETLVAFDPETKRYSLDIGILAIARAAIARNDFASIVQPRLTALSEQFGISAIAVQIFSDQHMIVAALAKATAPFRLQVDLGSRFPALISATGRCLVAFGEVEPERLRDRFEALKWELTPSYDQWCAQIAETRNRGYAVDDGNYIVGVTLIAVPVFDSQGRMKQSIIAAGMTDRIAGHGTARIAAEMRRLRDETQAAMLDTAAPVAGRHA